MASWTDQIPQFNPYISQLPVEAMVSVGMEKQKRYDEGIQKIQSQIDKVAGLDIIRDIDKQYLQSKLNELGSNLRTVAAGDFSNYQLVNSVGGMVKQVSNDVNIQNAVSSTAFIRKQKSIMDDERKQGKLHKNNEIFFNDQLNGYLSNKQVGQVFGTHYTPYSDYLKKWMDVQGKLKDKEIQVDKPFLMDGAGNYVDKEGNPLPPGAKPIPNDYMLREKFKGVNAQRIKEAVMSTMDDNDYNQMRIDAYVKYRGTTPDEMVADLQSDFDKNNAATKKTIENLTLIKNQNLTDQEAVDAIDKQIAEYQKQLDNNKSSLEESIADLRNNPEGFKTKMYMMNSINNFANSFSNMSHIMEIVDSPIRKQMNEDRNYNMTVLKFQRDNEQWQKEYDLKLLTEQRLSGKEEFDKKLELYKLGLGPSPLGPQVGKYVGAPPTDKEFIDGMIESFQEGAKLENLEKQRNELKMSWAKNQPSKTDYEKQLNRKLTDAEYRKMLDDQFNLDYNKYSNGESVDADSRKIFDQYSKADKLYKLSANTIARLSQQADEMHPEIKEVVDNLSSNRVDFIQWRPTVFPSGRPNPRGENYVALSKSAREIYDDVMSGKANLAVDRALLGDIRLNYPGLNIFYEIPKSGTHIVGSDKTKPVLLAVVDALNRTQTSTKQRNKDFTALLGKEINALAPLSQSLPADAPAKMLPMILEKFGREQKGETEQISGFVKGKDFDIDVTRALALDKDTKSTYTTFGDKTYVTLVGKYGKNPAAEQKFAITKSEFTDIFPFLADQTDTDFLQKAAANGSTNYGYKGVKSALMNKDDAFTKANYTIPSKKFIVKADIFFDQNDKNSTTPVIYIKSKKTGKIIPITSEGNLTFPGSESSIYQIDDLSILTQLKNKNINADF